MEFRNLIARDVDFQNLSSALNSQLKNMESKLMKNLDISNQRNNLQCAEN